MSSDELLVGIDVGTTACKAAVVRASDGTEVAHGAARTPWTVVPTGKRERLRRRRGES